MKSFIRAITITIVLTLIPAGSTRAQIAPPTAPTAPAAAPATPPEAPTVPAEAPAAPAIPSPQAVSESADKALGSLLSDLDEKLIQLNIATTGQYGGGNVLVIPTAEIMPQDMVTMMEDMTVMCRILDKKLAESHLISGNFLSSSGRLSLAFSRNSSPIEAMYVQGYGALFLTKVDFLLSPPPEAPEEKETEEEDTDPLWTQMRQEIYAPEEVSRGRSTGDRPEEKYDAGKVEELKETLIKTLKHATNIRNLKPDESVILTVVGKAGQYGPFVTQVYKSGDSKYIATGSAGAGSGSLSPTVLTIRAKKSDIDDFAEGKLSFDQFSEKTQLFSYSYLGEKMGEPSRSFPTNVIFEGRRSSRSSRSSRDRLR